MYHRQNQMHWLKPVRYVLSTVRPWMGLVVVVVVDRGVLVLRSVLAVVLVATAAAVMRVVVAAAAEIAVEAAAVGLQSCLP